MGNMLKTKNLAEKESDVVDQWGEILASIAYAIRCSYHSTLQETPGKLVFGRDMLLNISFSPDYKSIWKNKQKRINYDNARENSKRAPHVYKTGDYAYILKDGVYRKLKGNKRGPFCVTEVFTDNTVWLQKGIVNEHINIRRLTPHFERPPN